MAFHPVLDRKTVLDQLHRPSPNPFEPDEETVHPWRSGLLYQRFQKPMLRIWDQYSGSQPGEDFSMLSRAPEMRLDDQESRRTSLAKHLDYRDWTPSPYISFTTSETRIESLAQMRIKRGAQFLTVIDPNSRLRNGLPILNVEAEMGYYLIKDPYRRSNEYYADEYLCLWQVTTAERIGVYDWNSLVKDKNCRQRKEGLDDLQEVFAGLSSEFVKLADLYTC
ncbi:hypothetical protein F5B17DRAFT_444480 [Nemania serpens]|nr:hypothetical protein F5B17DRAFT_444480 [Nemania serpens]